MKKSKGYFTNIDGEQFYKIENYDCMEDFFMTITSASDVWNFCWSQGGITAGRIDCDNAIFPYYTADKVKDAKSYTGAYTAIRIENSEADEKEILWEPFASLSSSPAIRKIVEKNITRNIYKNTTGTEVCFEEINDELQLSFRYSWTSSSKYGLVRKVEIKNFGKKNVSLKILDGCQNILPACVTADFQNNKSVLLDAYKKTDLDEDSNLALFAVSSIVTDKAEPSEGLFANTCWFSSDDKLIIAPDAPQQFAEKGSVEEIKIVKGKRAGAFICKSVLLESAGEINDTSSVSWYQVFNTHLNASQIASLKKELTDRNTLTKTLETDIEDGKKLMQTYIAQTDGLQTTAQTMTCVHHSENVMFNIMRGGFFADEGKISLSDFVKFVDIRNKSLVQKAKEVTDGLKNSKAGISKAGILKTDKSNANINTNSANHTAKDELVFYSDLESAIQKEMNPQLLRLFYEYMPLIFSRRHGDPSRPWNRFNIHLCDSDGNPILNYEGNWRDIFQNWEALAWSYPQYIKNMTAKFLNAMTIDGFNPYRISREGIDWETPDPDDPWAQIGYWGDHQVIYLQKLLEVYAKLNKKQLVDELSEKIYASSNVPYRIKSYAEILKDPRNSISFDYELSSKLKKLAAEKGSDAKLVAAEGTTNTDVSANTSVNSNTNTDENANSSKNPNTEVALVTLTTKLIQIVIAKMANFVPGGGIWLNTQRPEWNDANNALAGYGLSMVTLYYLHRFVKFLISLFESSDAEEFNLPVDVADCFTSLGKLYTETSAEKAAKDSELRKSFVDAEGLIFEKERINLYKNGYGNNEKSLKKDEILTNLLAILNTIKTTITLNRRNDGLYHAYNTMKINCQNSNSTGGTIEIEYLQEMLEGQVAVLSAGMLNPNEALDVLKALQKSRMYEPRQNSYMLYPDKELAPFEEKNCISESDAAQLKALIDRTGTAILQKDCNESWHFNGEFCNVSFLQDACNSLSKELRPTESELSKLEALYEKTFHHQSFTGRSGTFYAYEGLGSIYWHMVSKLLLATQENIFAAIKSSSDNITQALTQAYYEIRSGIGFNKDAELYGAFPADPYSHTPSGQGAKQPGMTGQVKEEILTRWGELGVDITDGCASFNPKFLKKNEFFEEGCQKGTLCFTWCGIPVTYRLVSVADINATKTSNTYFVSEPATSADKNSKELKLIVTNSDGTLNARTYTAGTPAFLTAAETSDLFARNKKIGKIDVEVLL